VLDRIYQEEAASRRWVRFLDTRPVLALPGQTHYAPYLPGPDGRWKRTRQIDEVHLTLFGGGLVGDAVIGVMQHEIDVSLQSSAREAHVRQRLR